jgi:hypothetical protein
MDAYNAPMFLLALVLAIVGIARMIRLRQPYNVGDLVLIKDARPPQAGEIQEISTWREVNGAPHENIPCYRVKFHVYDVRGESIIRWLGKSSIRPLTVQDAYDLSVRTLRGNK